MASQDTITDSAQKDSIAEYPTTQHYETGRGVDLDDPHIAALEDNPEIAEKISLSSIIAVFFLGMSFVAPVGCGFILVTGILFQIGQSLGDTVNIVWIAGGWAVASSVSFAIAGGFSDIFGRRIPLLAGHVLVIVGGIISATADTTKIVAAGSTVIGFGCGFVFVAYAGVPEMLPNKYRGIGLGWTELCLNIPWASFSVILGNLLYEHAKGSWRWVYYITIIYAALCLVGCGLFYYPPARPRMDYDKTRWQEIKELDWIGLALYTGGFTTLLIGLTWAGTPGHPWNGASVIAPIIIGSAVLASSFAYDFTLAQNPLFPLDLFKQVREFSVLLVLLFASGVIFHPMAGLLPQMSLHLFSSDGVQIGIIAIPAGIGAVFGGWVIPSLLQKIKHIRMQLIVAMSIQTLFTGLYAVAMPGNKAAYMAFQFFGQGTFTWITTIAYVCAGLHVPQSKLGTASGLLGTFRSGGGSVGIAVFNTIFNGVLNAQLAPRIVAAAMANSFPASELDQLIPAVIQNAVGVPFVFSSIPNATPAVQAATSTALKEAYGYAFQRVAWAAIPFGVVGIIAAWFINDPSEYLTNHTAIYMEKDLLTGEKRVYGAKDVDGGLDEKSAA